MHRPTPLNVIDTLTADGLRGVDQHLGFAKQSVAEADAAGNQHDATFWRRVADRWHGKRLDLTAA